PQPVLARGGVVLSRRPGPDLHPLRIADAADTVRRSVAWPDRWHAQLPAVACLCTADGHRFRRAGRADGGFRCRAEPAGAPAIALGAGAFRAVLRGLRAGHVRPLRAAPAAGAEWPPRPPGR